MLGIVKQPATAENGPMAGASPDITLPKVHRKDGKGAAILFADVSKSMLMHERLGDLAARELIDRLLAMADKAIRAHRGRVIKTIGDEILAVLPTADAAARAARDLLVVVDKCEVQGGFKPAMHVGLHSGGFLERGGDVFGDAVNVASRLTAFAQAGQILTTTASAPGISPLVRQSMRKLGPLDIRGRIEQIQVEEIAWREVADAEATFTEPANVVPLQAVRLLLRVGARQWIAGPRAKHLTIGRDPFSDICIVSSDASRSHGYVEYRNGSFFYTDVSLNGSYVSFGDASESLVQRSQVVLSGRGVICFGHTSGHPGERVEFVVESVG